MATIRITTTEEEQSIVLNTIKKLQGDTVPVSTIASMCGLSQSRTRYALVDLEDAGTIKKVPTKAFNKHYIRYRYDIIK